MQFVSKHGGKKTGGKKMGGKKSGGKKSGGGGGGGKKTGGKKSRYRNPRCRILLNLIYTWMGDRLDLYIPNKYLLTFS